MILRKPEPRKGIFKISDMRKSLYWTTIFWVVTQQAMVIPYRRFGTCRFSRNVGTELTQLSAL